MTASFPFGALLMLGDDLRHWLLGNWYPPRKVRFLRVRKIFTYLIWDPLQMLMILVVSLLIFGYFLARPYVMIEAVLALRNPPEGTYTTVSWTSYIPHLG